MKRMRIFTEKISPVNKENPSWERSAAFVKLRNRLYKSRRMIVAFVLGNLLMVSTGYGFDVTISTNASSGGSWSALTNGTYTFTPTTNATVNVADITIRLIGNKTYTAGNITINTGIDQTSGNITISNAISAAPLNSTNNTLTISAIGSITVNTSINLTGGQDQGNNKAGYPGTSIVLNAGSNVLISAEINTSGSAGTGSGNGGNAGNISINGPGGISLSANLTALGGSTVTGTAGLNGTVTINDGAATVTTGGINDGQTATSIISGGSFIKQGAGTFLLAGQSTFTSLTISAGNLTIPAGGQVTVTGATVINAANGLTIESLSELNGGAGTGSFITGTTSGTGSTIVKRYMSPRKWHIVSSPVSGQTISGFLGTNPNIPTNTVTDHTTERGMRNYLPSVDQWSDYYIEATPGSINPGNGFLVRVRGLESTTKQVTFTGTLNAGNISVTGLTAGKWNCIGNPYTSALKLNSAGTTDNFLDVNAANLDMNFGGIYLWKQSNEELNDAFATGVYEPVTNVGSVSEVQQGQAFMVKMTATATSLSFTNAMQSHNTGLELKSTDGIWPTIKLTATSDSITSSTIIAFHEGMTPGLDPTYDAGLLKGGAFVEVYTRLVEDNGIPFDIQALPADYQSTVVPVGIDCTKGGPVTFSAELLHVSSSCQVLLEDKLNKVLTDLSEHSYTTDLMGSTVSQDRFFLHTSYSTTGIDSRDGIQTLRAWAVNNLEMKISGKVTSGAIATLYDLQGREVIVSQLQEGNLNSVPLRGLKQGVYMLRVQDNSRVQTQKVMISQ